MSTPVYGRKLDQYSVQELKILLKEEEERLSKVKRQIANRQKEKATGIKLTTDENGVTRRVFSEKEKEELKKCFDEIDTNGDNTINKDELKVLLNEKFSGDDWSDKQIQKVMNALDTNKDGTITFDEFLEWWATDSKNINVKGLRSLKGKLISGNSYLGARFCGTNVATTTTTTNKDVSEYSSQVSFGDYDEKNATGLHLQISPNTEEEHKQAVTYSGPDWFNDLYLQTFMLMKDDKGFSGQAKARFEVNNEEGARKLVISLEEAMFSIVRKTFDFDRLSEKDATTLKQHGLEPKGTARDIVSKFRELCYDVVNKGAVHFDEGEIEVTEEMKEKPEGILANALLELQDADIDDFACFFLRFEQHKNEVHIVGGCEVNSNYYAKFSNYTNILAQSLKECVFSFGIGGDLCKHLGNVMENDARILDMVNWGIRANTSIRCSSTFVEEVLPLFKMVSGSSKFDSVDFLMGLLAGGTTCSSFSQKLVFRNLFTNVERIVDFLVADARCVFQGNAGGESGYEWGPEQDDRLDELSSWAHFLVKAFQEKVRPSNKMYRSSIRQMLETLDGVKDHGLIEALSSSDPKLLNVMASCPLAKAEVTYTGDWKPFVLLPTKEFKDKFHQKDGLPSGESAEFLAELKERKEMIDDDAAIREIEKTFEPAMQHLEDTKGTALMAGKEGLIFVSGLLKFLIRKPAQVYNCIFGEGSDSDEDSDDDDDEDDLSSDPGIELGTGVSRSSCSSDISSTG